MQIIATDVKNNKASYHGIILQFLGNWKMVQSTYNVLPWEKKDDTVTEK